jgi:hypothetical protein
MLFHIVSSAMGWMDPGPTRDCKEEANDENYTTKANNYASMQVNRMCHYAVSAC